jgi:hypothetical protein
MSWQGLVNDNPELGEFFLSGRAQLVEDAATRETAVRATSYDVADRYILFELNLDQALGTTYSSDGPVRRLWRRQLNALSRPGS